MARSRWTLAEQLYGGLMLVTCFVSFGAWVFTAAFTDNPSLGFVSFVATFSLSAAAAEPWRRSIQRRQREAPANPPPPELSPETLKRANEMGIANMATQIVILAAATYFRTFWLIALVGLGTTALWLRHRETDARGTAAWLGTFIGIYGVLCWIVLAYSR